MQRTLITASFLSLLTLSASAQVPAAPTQSGGEAAEPAPTPFETAKSLAERGRLEKAMVLLNQLAAQSPEPAGVERWRGIIFYQQGQFPEAIEAFTKAAAQDPGDRESIEMHGVSLFRTGRSADAIPFLEQARAAVENANVDPEYVLGLCYTDVKRYDDARHAFAAQYGFAPDSAEAYLLAGRLFLRREFPAEAAIQARKASSSRKWPWPRGMFQARSTNWKPNASSIRSTDLSMTGSATPTSATASLPRPAWR